MENAYFALKSRNQLFPIRFQSFAQKEHFLRFLRFPDLPGPPGVGRWSPGTGLGYFEPQALRPLCLQRGSRKRGPDMHRVPTTMTGLRLPNVCTHPGFVTTTDAKTTVQVQSVASNSSTSEAI